jgi:hypothetical protein
MDTITELRHAIAARQIIEAARDEIAKTLDAAARKIRALQASCHSVAVADSLMAARTALEGDTRYDCLDAIERILSDEMTPDGLLETLVEEEQPAIFERDPFDACRALSDAERAAIGSQS